MEISFEKIKKLVIKLWWVVVACAVFGGILGFVVGRSSIKTEYASTAQIIVDIDYLEDKYTTVKGYDNEGNIIYDRNYSAGYNTAHSLIPTFEKVLFSKELVLSRVAETYNKNALQAGKTRGYSADQLAGMFKFEFTTNTLLMYVTCSAKSAEDSEYLLNLLCQYGLENVNNNSDAVKFMVAELEVHSYTATLAGSENEIKAYQMRIDNANDEIYDYVRQNSEVYLQRDSIRQGFSFVEREDKLEVTYQSANQTITDLVMRYVTSDPTLVGNMTMETNFFDKPDVKYEKEISDAQKQIVSNTKLFVLIFIIVFAVLGVVGIYVYDYVLDKKAKDKENKEVQETK